jgi:hypothetical protein
MQFFDKDDNALGDEECAFIAKIASDNITGFM